MKFFFFITIIILYTACGTQSDRRDISASIVYTPNINTSLINNLDEYIDSLEYLIPNDILPSPLKIVLDNKKDIYILGFDGSLTFVDNKGNVQHNFIPKGRARNEYNKINDIAIRQSPHELLILDETRVLSFSINNKDSIYSFRTPDGIPFDAIAPSGENNTFLFSAFPKNSEDIALTKDYLLKIVTRNGEIVQEYLKREDCTFSIGNITQSSNNEYYIRPQNNHNIFYLLRNDSIEAKYKINFLEDNIPHRYFYDKDSDIGAYMRAPYYKLPSFAYLTNNTLYFKCAGPNASEINYLLDKSNNKKGIKWENSMNDPDIRFIGVDDKSYYLMFYKHYLDDYKDKENGPLFKSLIKRISQDQPFRNSDAIFVKVYFSI